MPGKITDDKRKEGEKITVALLDKARVKEATPQEQEEIAVSRGSLMATILSTLLIRVSSRISFVILSFYLGEHFASATIVVIVLEAFYVSELLIAPIVGSLSDRMGRKPFLLLAPVLACLAAGCLLLAARLFPRPTAQIFDLKLLLLLVIILVGRLLEGAATGMNVPATLGYITDATTGSERLRARVVTAFEIVTVGGLVIAIPLGGKISSVLDTWGFLAVIAIYAVTLLLIVLGVEESVRRQGGRQGRGIAGSSLLDGLKMIRYRRIYTFLPAWFSVNSLVGAWTVLMTIMLSYPNPQADARHPGQLLYGGFSKMEATLWVGLFALIFLVGMGLWMILLPRLRRTTIMLIGLGGLALAIVSLTIINSLAENPQVLPSAAHPFMFVLITLAMIGALLLSGFTPVSLTQMGAIAEAVPRKRGAIMGLYSVVLAIGQLLGATLGGSFVDLAGFYGLMIFSVIMGLVSLVSVLYMRAHAHDQIGASGK